MSTAAVPPRRAGVPTETAMRRGRIALAVLGAVALVVGVALLLNPDVAAHTLALLIGLGLVVGGCLEIAGREATGSSRVGSVVVGAILIVGGLIAAFWPGVTLWTLAIITGISLMLHGVGRLFLAFSARREVPGWVWLAVAGAVNVVIGLLALVWPAATVLVLSLLFGVQVLVFGGFLIGAAMLMAPADPARNGG
jgi:uncharacterized membrane protein HdeD (DUF308 family)